LSSRTVTLVAAVALDSFAMARRPMPRLLLLQ